MNKYVVVAFAAGAVIGSAAGGLISRFIFKKKYEKKYEEDTNREIAEVKKHYEKKLKDELEKYIETNGRLTEELLRNGYSVNDSEEVTIDTGKEKVSENVLVKNEGSTGEHVDYTEFYDAADYEHPEDDLISEEERNYIDGRNLTEESNSAGAPFLISYDEFCDRPELDKYTLLYYIGDNILTDEEDNEIIDLPLTIGSALEDSNFLYEDISLIYVRNLKFGCDYEITKVNASYSDLYRG